MPDASEYTRGERAAGILGLALFLFLAALAADLASGGKLTSKLGGRGCGCPEEGAPGDGQP